MIDQNEFTMTVNPINKNGVTFWVIRLFNLETKKFEEYRTDDKTGQKIDEYLRSVCNNLWSWLPQSVSYDIYDPVIYKEKYFEIMQVFGSKLTFISGEIF
jgi:hypothetical protein